MSRHLAAQHRARVTHPDRSLFQEELQLRGGFVTSPATPEVRHTDVMSQHTDADVTVAGVLVVVGLGVALGITIGVCLLFLFILIMKR